MMSQARKTFVIQLDPVDAAALEPALRGWVEELDTGSSTQFASSTALVAFLVNALQRPGTPPAGTET
jgi:hypothetical protein